MNNFEQACVHLCVSYIILLSVLLSQTECQKEHLGTPSVIRLSTSISQACEDFTTAMSISAEIPSPHGLLL